MKKEKSKKNAVNQSSHCRPEDENPLCDTDQSTNKILEFVLEPLEDVHDRGIAGCAEGNPMVARNLRRLSVRLLRLAWLIEYGDGHSDVPSILESKYLLDTHGVTWLKDLATQLEAASGWVPLGLLQHGAKE